MLYVMLCFHIHQPFRLGTVHLYERSTDLFDDGINRAVLENVSQSCYIPSCILLKGMIDRYGVDFKFSFSITGTAVQQLEMWKPDVLEQLCGLAATGSVELMGETYYHSLFSHYDREEFVEQVCLHTEMMKHQFSMQPRVFRNTELLYDDRVSDYLSSLNQFRVLLCEDAVGEQFPMLSACTSYNDIHLLLLRNHRLTDDIAFRFSSTDWSGCPLSAKEYVSLMEKYGELAEDETDSSLLLYMDYETLGEHYTESSGIFQFFQDLVEIILNSTHIRFSWPSDSQYRSRRPSKRLSVKKPVSWADSGKDLSAWLSSDLQQNAMNSMLEVWDRVKRSGDERLLERVRRLSSSDHFYYMYPWKDGADAAVHKRFSPYDSPEEAYMRYMRALTLLELKLF